MNLRELPNINVANSLWAVPLFLSLLFFPLNQINTTPDGAWYIASGLSIYNGNGFINSDFTPVLNRGPVFPALISLSFHILGVSLTSAFLVSRFFFVLNGLIVYFLGRKLFNKWVGLLSSLLVLVSYEINLWSSFVLLDNIFPFFMLSFIYLGYSALESQSMPKFAFAGLVLGIGSLTKELSLVFLPLVFLCWLLIPHYRTGKNIGGAFACLCVFFAVLCPWLWYIDLKSGSLLNYLGNNWPLFYNAMLPPAVPGSGGDAHFFSGVAEDTVFLYQNYVRGIFFLTPVLFISYLFLLIEAVRGKRQALILTFSVFLFLPVLLYVARDSLRTGQNLIFYCISYIIIANFIVTSGKFLSARLPGFAGNLRKMNRLKAAAAMMMICVIPAAQALADNRMLSLLRGESEIGFCYYRNCLENTTGWHNPVTRETGKWIARSLLSNSSIMCDWFWLDALYFYAGGKCRFYEIPYQVLRGHNTGGIEIKRKNLFIWPNNNVAETRGGRMMVLNEEDLLGEIRQKHIDFIIVTQRRNFISLYFAENPGFQKIFDAGVIKIFRVKHPVSGIDFKLKIGSRTGEYLHNMKRKQLSKYWNICRQLSQMGMDEMLVRKIEAGDLETVETFRIY